MSDTQLATVEQSIAVPDQLKDFVPDLMQIGAALPQIAGVTPERCLRIFLTALNKNRKLLECSKPSVYGCLLDLAALGLEPNTPAGHAYLIPYAGQCTLQVGYRGYVALAYRSQGVKTISAGVIREGDSITYRLGTDPFVEHIPTLGEGRSERAIIGSWVVISMQGGNFADVIDADQLKAFEAAMLRQNKGKATPAWQFFKEEMLKKSHLKRCHKLMPLGEHVARAVELEHDRAELPVRRSPDKPLLIKRGMQGEVVTDAEGNATALVDAVDMPENFNPDTGEFSW